MTWNPFRMLYEQNVFNLREVWLLLGDGVKTWSSVERFISPAFGSFSFMHGGPISDRSVSWRYGLLYSLLYSLLFASKVGHRDFIGMTDDGSSIPSDWTGGIFDRSNITPVALIRKQLFKTHS